MFCSKCGANLSSDSSFCSSCGNATSHEKSKSDAPDPKQSNGSGNLSKGQALGGIFFGIVAIIIFASIDTDESSASAEGSRVSIESASASNPSPVPVVPRLSPLDGSNVPADNVGLRVNKLEDSRGRIGCDIHSEAYNNSSVVMQNLSFEVQLHDATGLLIDTKHWWYENVRPDKSVAFQMSYVENVPCNEIQKAVVTAMRCVADGVSYSAGACAKSLSFPDGLLVWTLNGQ